MILKQTFTSDDAWAGMKMSPACPMTVVEMESCTYDGRKISN